MLAFLPWFCIVILDIVALSNGWPMPHLWAITAACLMGWILYPKKSTKIGMITVLVLVFCQYLSITQLYHIVTGHVVLLLFVGSCFSYLMVKHRVHEVISTNTLAYVEPKTLSGLTVLMMLIAAFLSMWISNTSAVVMLIPVVIASAKQLDIDPATMLIAIAYGATIGGMMTPIGTPSNLVAVDYAERFFDIKISFSEWLIAASPFAIALLAALTVYFLAMYRRSIDIKIPAVEVAAHQKKIIYMISACILLWATKTLPLGGWEGLLGVTASEENIGLVALLLCSQFLTPDRKRLWGPEDIPKIGYSSIVMVMTGLCIAQAVKLSGIIEIVSAYVVTFAEISSATWVLMVASLVSVLTELCSNTAVTALSLTLTEMMMKVSSLGPLPCILMVTLSANSAFILPTATPPNALILGTGKVKLSRMMLLGSAMSCLSVIILYNFYL